MYVTPRYTEKRSLRLGTSLWRAGVQQIEAAHWLEVDSHERACVVKTAATLRHVHLRSDCSSEEYAVDIGEEITAEVARHAREAAVLRGAFCSEWLPHSSTRHEGWLLNSRRGGHAPPLSATAGARNHRAR